MRTWIIWLSLILTACAKQPAQEEAQLHGYCTAAMLDLMIYLNREDPSTDINKTAREFETRLQHLMSKESLDFYLTENTGRSWWNGQFAWGKDFLAAQESDVMPLVESVPAKCAIFFKK
jgi:hypothetical protein